MKKYLLILANGSESIAFSEKDYIVGEAFGWVGIVKSIYGNDIMEMIIEKYYLESGAKLVNYAEGTKGVDCWFETPHVIQHRCLSFDDFATIKP